MIPPVRRALALLAGVAALAAGSPRTVGALPVQDARPALTLVDQSVVAPPGAAVSFVVGGSEVPVGATIRVAVRDRVRSRSELRQATEGRNLRAVRATASVTEDQVARREDGSLELTLADGPDGLAVPDGPGVYPVTLTLTDGSGARVGDPLVTQLVVPPTDAVAPLAVVLLADLDLPAAREVDGVAPDAVEDLADVAGALQSAAGMPVTLAPEPDALRLLAAAPEDGRSATALDRLRRLAEGRTALARPYVDVAPDALVGAGLDGDLARQLDLGGAAVRDVLGVVPDEGTWIGRAPLARAGLELLDGAGIEQVVVGTEQIAPTNDGVYTLARPFRLVAGSRATTGEGLDAVVVDEATSARLAEPAATAGGVHAVAELAQLWLEQPTLPRLAVVRIDRTTRPDALRLLTRTLRAAPFAVVQDLADAVAGATPLRDARGATRRVPVAAGELPALPRATADQIRAARLQLDSLTSMAGDPATLLGPTEGDILRAEALDATTGARGAHLRDANTRVNAVLAAVAADGARTVTLTARSGSMPFTFTNDSGAPLSVVLRLRSPKLQFPGGTDLPLELPVGTTRLNVDLRTRASGSIPLQVLLTSPDGRLDLVDETYTVQSTAVSGVGIVLSAGALLFLLVWWGRHWREHRRSTKLVAAGDHPAAAGRRGDDDG